MRLAASRAAVLLLAASTLSCEKDPTRPPDSAECATTQATWTINSNPASVNEAGTLTTASCKLSRGSYADRYELVLNVAALVEIKLDSDDFDAYVVVRNSDDEYMTSDDDGGVETNSRLQFTMQPGTYYIMASAWYETDADIGNYSVTVNTVAAP